MYVVSILDVLVALATSARFGEKLILVGIQRSISVLARSSTALSFSLVHILVLSPGPVLLVCMGFPLREISGADPEKFNGGC